jgi:rhamnosyltransferase
MSSSGCAATAVTFSEVGLMDEEFFIDFVDVEWCLRCRQRGVKIVVVPDAVMVHSIGDIAVGSPLGLYHGIIHGPVRTYYKIRNAFLLARKRHVPLVFALHQVFSALAHNAIQLVFVKERALYLRTFVVAVTHGLRGVTGKRPAT